MSLSKFTESCHCDKNIEFSFSHSTKNQNLYMKCVTVFHYVLFQEIYPPKLSEFADVTDGACTENEILTQELVMLKVSQMIHSQLND